MNNILMVDFNFPWWGYALVFSFFSPVFQEANRHFKLQGELLLIWRSLTIFLLLILPVYFFIPWPTQYQFYIYLGLAACCFSYSEGQVLNLSKQYGGIFLTLSGALSTFIVFFIWLGLDTTFRQHLFTNTLEGACVLLAVFIGFWAHSHAKKDPEGAYKKELTTLLKLATASAVATSFVKTGMSYAPSVATAVLWSCFLNLAISLATFVRWYACNKPHSCAPLFDRRLIKGGVIIGMTSAIAAPLITMSFYTSPNPAYSNIMARLSIVWLFIYTHITGHPKHIKLSVLIGASIAALILILAQGQI